MAQQSNTLHTNCCIVGGGPAGMMLGFLLARAGIEVIVLEKHADFFRDFRGDTIHPSTLQIMDELGLLKEFLKVPHQEIRKFRAVFNDVTLQIADFSRLKISTPMLGLMPQWDFLKFVEKYASHYKGFTLMMNAKATDVIKKDGRVIGVLTETNEGIKEIYANLIVATDGRHSVMREKTGLKVISAGVPIDVLWFRISRINTDPEQILGRFSFGKLMVMLDRDEYWQCAYVIEKGGYEKIKQKELQGFRNDVQQVAPFLKDRVNELKTWDDIKLLGVDVDHLDQWYTEGLLCIGDAAHAMSPIGGVGINLAIQDAVAAANILYPALQQNMPVDSGFLKRVQKRRSFPTAFVQRLQITIQNNILETRISGKKPSKPPFFMRLLDAMPLLQQLPAKAIGMGIRPEHVKTPDIDEK